MVAVCDSSSHTPIPHLWIQTLSQSENLDCLCTHFVRSNVVIETAFLMDLLSLLFTVSHLDLLVKGVQEKHGKKNQS